MATTDCDYVTGLGHRGSLEESLRGLLASAAEFAIVIVDVIGLKQANEQGGFVAGDAILRAAADRLRIATRGPLDAVETYRLGGDELVAVYRGPDSVRQAAEAVRVLAAASVGPPLRAGMTAATRGETRESLLDRLYATVRRS